MNQQQTAERLVRMEANLERLGNGLEKTTHDHEARVRRLEAIMQAILGVVKVIAWLGAPTAVGIVLFMAKGH